MNEFIISTESLLTAEPSLRADGTKLRQQPLFDSIDWADILASPVPFVPQPKDHTDTTYFEARNCLQKLNVSQIDL